ncbi:unnamed protein product, partial [Rotaria magnacalcarata]
MLLYFALERLLMRRLRKRVILAPMSCRINNVSNQASVQEIQCDVNELPDMSSGSSGVSSRAKPIISKTVLIVLLVIVCVVAIAAITVPLLLTFLTSA